MLMHVQTAVCLWLLYVMPLQSTCMAAKTLCFGAAQHCSQLSLTYTSLQLTRGEAQPELMHVSMQVCQ